MFALLQGCWDILRYNIFGFCLQCWVCRLMVVHLDTVSQCLNTQIILSELNSNSILRPHVSPCRLFTDRHKQQQD